MGGHSWTYAPTEDYVRGTYVHNCHCTACRFEIRDSGHEYKPDITSCAHECASDIHCQTVLHDAHKSKCFWYNNTNSRGTEMPVLKQSSTYNVLSSGNEFTCWYKTEDYTHPRTVQLARRRHKAHRLRPCIPQLGPRPSTPQLRRPPLLATRPSTSLIPPQRAPASRSPMTTALLRLPTTIALGTQSTAKPQSRPAQDPGA